MMKIKRAAHIFMGFRKVPVLNVHHLASGAFPVQVDDRLIAISVLSGVAHPVEDDDLKVLQRVNADCWVPNSEIIEELAVSEDRIDALVAVGLLISDSDEAEATRLRQANEVIAQQAWFDAAACYHFMSRWKDIDVWKEQDWRDVSSAKLAERRMLRQGAPPPQFDGLGTEGPIQDLPLDSEKSPLADILKRRKTTRNFDTTSKLGLDTFSNILYRTFGCHGYVEIANRVVILKKTSPSGGASHAIEVYPLVINVEGIETGLYHYNVERHGLAPLQTFNIEEARRMATEYAAGQDYFAGAAVVFLLTARFYRSFWKYRSHAKAYRVLLMDAAHLSQTLALVSAELDIGSFVTAAINESNIDSDLRLDGVPQGSVLVCGCGPIDETAKAFEPGFRKYIPRETKIPE